MRKRVLITKTAVTAIAMFLLAGMAGCRNQITIESTPPGATVEIDSVEMGTTPFTWTSPKVGDVTVVVSKQGYKTETKRINYSKGRATYEFALQPSAWIKEDTRNEWGDVVGFRYVQTVTAIGGRSSRSSSGRTLKIICDSESNATVEISPDDDIGGLNLGGFYANVSLRDADGIEHGSFHVRKSGWCGSSCREFIDLLIKDDEYKILLAGEAGMMGMERWNVNATIRGSLPSDVNHKREAERKKKLQEEEAERIRLRTMSGSFTDTRDGKVYRTVKIGNQTWMAENLNYQTNNSWCYHNDTSNCTKYGRLYNWDMATTACPQGWRLSTREDWKNLVDVAGGEREGVGKLKSKSGWNMKGDINNNDADEFGFTALPGGYRNHGGGFNEGGSRGGWWTTDNGEMIERAYAWSIYRNLWGWWINETGNFDNAGSVIGYSVRCVMME